MEKILVKRLTEGRFEIFSIPIEEMEIGDGVRIGWNGCNIAEWSVYEKDVDGKRCFAVKDANSLVSFRLPKSETRVNRSATIVFPIEKKREAVEYAQDSQEYAQAINLLRGLKLA